MGGVQVKEVVNAKKICDYAITSHSTKITEENNINLLKNCRIERAIEAIKNMDSSEITDEERGNMIAFLEEKRKIVQQGEMKEQLFVRMAELGYGNGGVVLKVEHKPTGIIMARKVCMCAYNIYRGLYVCIFACT